MASARRRVDFRVLARTAIVAGFVGLGLLQAAVVSEALIRARLDDSMLPAPTRLYARPVVLTPGERIDRDRVRLQLERQGYQAVRRSRVGVGQYYLGRGTWVIGRRAFRLHSDLDPGGVTVVRLDSRDRIRTISDDAGNRLRFATLEPEELGRPAGGPREDRTPLALADVPEVVVDAVLSVEDQRFRRHHGMDVRRVAGAALANVRAGKVVQGGSTITQQLAKNLFLSPRRTATRKVRELAMAVTLEWRYSKDEILQAYLNQIYLGQDGGVAIHGVGRAAQFYFDKDVSQLSVSEGAMLAGLIRGPSLYSPFRRPQAGHDRRDLVLRLMYENEVITDSEYRNALEEPLGLRTRPEATRIGRHFADYVTETLSQQHGDEAIGSGLTVFTTLDMQLQRAAEDAVRSGLDRLEANAPYLRRDDKPLQAALVALNPHTGEILAMVGGRSYVSAPFNRAVNARRQPGSSFKPIVALTALAQRGPYTLATILDDEPLAVETAVGLWEPSNYDRRFRGSVTLREALERSLNVPFARLGMDVGPERIVETARALGLSGSLPAVLSLALGSAEVTPLGMTRAFGVFAADGYRANLQVTLGVMNSQGEIMSRLTPDGEYVFDAADTYLITSALRGAVERGTGRRVRSLGFRGPVAAKSGTTNGYRDAWFIGYTPELAVGVWVGFDDGKSTGLPGSRAALPIFTSFLKDAVGPRGGRDFPTPRDIEVVRVNRESGLRANYGCSGEPEVFVRGTAPEEGCSRFNRRESRRRLSRARENGWRDRGRRGGR